MADLQENSGQGNLSADGLNDPAAFLARSLKSLQAADLSGSAGSAGMSASAIRYAHSDDWDKAISDWSRSFSLPLQPAAKGNCDNAVNDFLNAEDLLSAGDLHRASQMFRDVCAAFMLSATSSTESSLSQKYLPYFILSSLRQVQCSDQLGQPTEALKACASIEALIPADRNSLCESGMAYLLASRLTGARLALQINEPLLARSLLYVAIAEGAVYFSDRVASRLNAGRPMLPSSSMAEFTASLKALKGSLDIREPRDPGLRALGIGVSGIAELAQGCCIDAAKRIERALIFAERYNRGLPNYYKLPLLLADALYYTGSAANRSDGQQIVVSARRQFIKLLSLQSLDAPATVMAYLEIARHWQAHEISAGQLNRLIDLQRRIKRCQSLLLHKYDSSPDNIHAYCSEVLRMVRYYRDFGEHSRAIRLLIPLVSERLAIFKSLPCPDSPPHAVPSSVKRIPSAIADPGAASRLKPELRAEILGEYADLILHQLRISKQSFLDRRIVNRVFASMGPGGTYDICKLGVVARREQIFILTRAYGQNDSRVLEAHLKYAEALLAQERFDEAKEEILVAESMPASGMLYRGWIAYVKSAYKLALGLLNGAQGADAFAELSLKHLNKVSGENPLIRVFALDQAALVIQAHVHSQLSEEVDNFSEVLFERLCSFRTAEGHLNAAADLLRKSGYSNSPEMLYILSRLEHLLFRIHELPEDTNPDWLTNYDLIKQIRSEKDRIALQLKALASQKSAS